MAMNFLNTLISGASNLMFNLQQRDNSGVSQLFSQANTPSMSLSPSEFTPRKESTVLSDLLLSNDFGTSNQNAISLNNYQGNNQRDSMISGDCLPFGFFNQYSIPTSGVSFQQDTLGAFNNTLINPNVQIEDQAQQSYLLSQLIIEQQKNLIGQILLSNQSQNVASSSTAFTMPQLQSTVAAPVVDTMEKKSRKNLKSEETEDSQERNCSALKKSLRKKEKKINNCGHHDKEHYAKGMCSNCYHKYGRTKKPWLCPHTKLYACGLCQNCYINKYNQRKRVEGAEQIEGSDEKIRQMIEDNTEQVEFEKRDTLQKKKQLSHTAADGDDEHEEGEEEEA